MQSNYPLKRFDEYGVGQHIMDCDVAIGRVEAMEVHQDRNVGYLLVVNEKGEYTIYTCECNVRCGLSVVNRCIPGYVMKAFAGVLLGEEDAWVSPEPVVAPKKDAPRVPKTEDVLGDLMTGESKVEPESKPEPETEPEFELATVPFFDFVGG